MSTEHNGGNIQNTITLEEHDGVNNAKRVNVVSGTITASSQVTVTPQQAWPDPKGYIGLVTITGSLAAASGNVTLDPGSRTGIVGNITLSDPKGFIGLVTVVGSLSAASGNVTLDAGSRTGILGNVTLSDSKTYIGLTTATIGNNPILGAGNNNIGDVDIASIAVGVNSIGFATVNVSNLARTITGNVTLSDAKTYVGLTTTTLGAGLEGIGFATVNVVNVARTITGNITLSDPKGFIGLVTVVGSLSAASGNVTLDAGSRTGIVGNVTLSDSKTFIGLTTTILAPTPILGTGDTTAAFTSSASGSMMNVLLRSVSGKPVNMDTSGRLQVNLVGLSSDTVATVEGPTDFDNLTNGGFALYTFTPSVVFDGTNWDRSRTANAANATTGIGLPGAGILGFDGTDYRRITTGTDGRLQGNVTVNNVARTITGNLTLSDPKGFIGLVTVVGSLSVPAGNVTLDAGSRTGILGNLTLSDAKTFIGLVSVGGGILNTITAVTDITNPVALKGNLTLSDSKTYIGLTTSTLGRGHEFVGLVTVVQSSAARTITGNLTLSDSKTFIGTVTAHNAYSSDVTVYAGVISATGNTTLFVAPASNRFFIKNLHVSSLGRSEIQFLSGATVLIPLTSLATTSGYAVHYGEVGWPGRVAADALVANLNGAATVSIGVTYRIAP